MWEEGGEYQPQHRVYLVKKRFWSLQFLKELTGRISKKIKAFSLRWSLILLYGTLSLWLLQDHTTSYNDSVSRQNPWVGNIAAKSMMSEGNRAPLPVNVDQWPSLHRYIINEFSASKFPATYDFFTFDSSAQISMFPSVRNKINCFLGNQSLSVYC